MEIKTTEEIQQISCGIYKKAKCPIGRDIEELISFDEKKFNKKWVAVDDIFEYIEKSLYNINDYDGDYTMALNDLKKELSEVKDE